MKKYENDKTKIEFFIPMAPPTATHQGKKVSVRNGKPVVYEPDELKAARAKLTAHLAKFVPGRPLSGPVWLGVKWLFPKGKHRDGEYKTTKPDTDNLEKLLKDVMEDLGFWKNDAQVASEHVEKFWAELPGLYVTAWEITGPGKEGKA